MLRKFFLLLIIFGMTTACSKKFITKNRFADIQYGSTAKEVEAVIGIPDSVIVTMRGNEHAYIERISYGKGNNFQRHYILIYSHGRLVDKQTREIKDETIKGLLD